MPSPVGHALAGAAIALAAYPAVCSPRWHAPRNDSQLRDVARGDAGGHDLARADSPRPVAGDLRGGLTPRTALVACVALAALPDVDLLYQPIHRAVTHSVGSTILITIIATAVTGWVTGRRSIGFGLLCGLAWGSHLVLDWMGADPTPPRGIKALWPFSDQWFISGWDVFRGTERRQLFTASSMIYNAKAVAQEIGIVGSVALVLAWWRRRQA